MIKYIIKRIILFVFTFFVTLSFVYIIFEMANMETWLRGNSHKEHLQLAWDSYVPYLKNVLSDNDWGSDIYGNTVFQNVVEEIPTTFKINFYAFMFYVPVGLFLGIFTAYYGGTWIDKVTSFFTVIFGSIPEYVLIGILMIVFAYSLGWFPFKYDPNPDDPWSFLLNIALPIIALSVVPILKIMMILRAELLEILNSNYILLVRSKGFNRMQMIWRHALKNSILPVLTEIPTIFTAVLSISFVIEIAYNINGAASLLFNSILSQNIDVSYISISTPTATLIVGFYILLVMVVAFISDISLSIFDPRINLGSKK